MPLFITDEEFDRLKSTGDTSSLAEKADAYIQNIHANLETVKAEADAASITAEQTCSVLEERYISLSSEFSALESRNSLLESDLQRHASELALSKSDTHQLQLKLIEKDGEIERLKAEVSELQKSKRQLLEVVGVRDTEICEKASTIRSYVDKITDLTDRAAQREARLSELDSELLRCRASADKLLQEKELIEKHNGWLNDELTMKVDSLLEQRRRSAEIEADLSAKLADMEKQHNECSSSLNRHKEMVKELESKVESLHRELCLARDDASAAEQQYSAEISTVSKLVDLYKESSEEWSKKAGELEGVIKALETHISQVESDYRDKLDKEAAARKGAEKESADLKEKLAKCESELESSRRASELDFLPLSSFTAEPLKLSSGTSDDSGDNLAIVPHVPAGVSGTALAASLLREGWSLAKMYTKYQEAADALRHEQMGRKQAEAILERVFHEIEEKASVILDERAEHERMAEAYALMDQKLQQSFSEQANLEKVIRELKAELKRHERDYSYAQKENMDLQKQVTILLKECQDVQLRCGYGNQEYMDEDVTALTDIDDESDAQKVISEHLLSIKDINGLVDQNAKLRSLVRSLSDEVENRGMQLKEQFEEELLKQKEEAASRVSAVLGRAEEQGRMIESLHSSVSMYRRLYEEEQRLRSSQPHTFSAPSVDGRKDIMLLLEGSQEATKRLQEQSSERLQCLEDELAKRKSEIMSLRSEKDKLAWDAKFAQERHDRILKELDHQKEELNGLLARNIEFSGIIVDYQKKMRESSNSVDKAEELSRKLNMELCVLKREKELLLNSEKRALDEVQDLSQKVHRLQATLDAIQSTEQVREEVRAAERAKQEEYIKQIEREWAEAKKELQEERNNVRTLSLDRENSMKDSIRQVEDTGKRLEAALQALATAEARANAAEKCFSDLERNSRLAEDKIGGRDSGPKPASSSGSDIVGDLRMANQEIERLKTEALASKNHMLQYKSIAEVNESALKQMEAAHERFKADAEQLKKSLEAEIGSLRDRVHELENENALKSVEAASAVTQKDDALSSALAEIANLKEETSNKVSQLMAMEVQVTVLKEDLEKAHLQSRSAQTNYERQVILQSETIQELTKTSQALASVQEEASALRRMLDTYKSENEELKTKWESEKLELENSKIHAEKKYGELNEQNKILHSQLEAMYMKVAEKDCDASGVTSASTNDDSPSEGGLSSVISYLRRSREIAETEISLLKQEKLRLQSQLERALKAAEAAETSLNVQRENSRNLMFSEDEFKALKLQVSEMNLLRESNMQLREENRFNFEECQKLREVARNAKVEAEKLQSILKERELEVDGLRKEIELLKKDKEHLERRISDMLEASKNLDPEDYNRLKREVEVKDTVIEETKELAAKLEQELASARLELAERDSRLPQVDSLKAEVEKQKKFIITLKRRGEMMSREKESLSKDKESLLKEKESLLKERESVVKEKDCLSKEKEALLREKEELNRGKQAVLKQLDELRHDKKAGVDASAEQAMRERDEKEARIQILESHLGRVQDSSKKEKENFKREKEIFIKKEKEKRDIMMKTIYEKSNSVQQEKKKFEDEHQKHKEAVRKISDELEKLKHSRDSLPEGTSVVQLLSGNDLDDQASAYVLAIENFEREAHLVLSDVRKQGSSVMDATPVVGSSNQVPPSEVPATATSTAPPIYPPAKVTGGKEKKTSFPKANVESRKSSRRLVRPQLSKSDEPQRDVEMSDLDKSKSAGKPSSAQDKATLPAVPVSSEPSIRKRRASPSPSELQVEPDQPGDSRSDLSEPLLKKSKGVEFLPEDFQTEPAASENVETIPTVEELLDAVTTSEGLSKETSESQKDAETVEGQGQGSGECLQPNDATEEDVLRDVADESLPNDAEPMLEDASNLQLEQDVEQYMTDGAEKEEGEMLPENSDLDIGDDAAAMENQDATDLQPEHSTEATMSSLSQTADDPSAAITVDVNETNSPENLNTNEQMEEGELVDDVAEDSDKSNDVDDQTAGDTDAVSGAIESNLSALETAVSREENPIVVTGQEPAQGPQIINLNERAQKQRLARLGQSPAPTSTSTSTSHTPVARRGRDGRGARSGRGSRGAGGRRPASGGRG